MLERGATTAWEWWDAIGDDGVVRGSLNHYSKAAVVSFLYTHVAGIRLDEIPDAAIRRLSPRAHRTASRAADSRGLAPPSTRRAGPIRSEWHLDGEAFALEVEIPGGSTASIELPDGLPPRRPGPASTRSPHPLHERHTMTLPAFPADFLWGVATAGHQNEGDNVDSDTWFARERHADGVPGPSGKACNGWELWRVDLDLVAGMGLNAYRFSVEWARVEPVEGEFSDEALDHYEAIVDGCLARGLAPDRDVQPLHVAALVREARRLARPRGARAVRAVLRRRDGPLRRPDRARRHASTSPTCPSCSPGSHLPGLRRASSSARRSRRPSAAAGVRALPAGNVMLPRGLRRAWRPA